MWPHRIPGKYEYYSRSKCELPNQRYIFEKPQVGCDNNILPACQSIVDHLPGQMNKNVISDVTGLTIDCFSVWAKRQTNR